MHLQHWLDRWENNQIGFHQQHINTHLEDLWADAHFPSGCRVFVPLCGKSRDMLWLRAQGHEVLGIEISPRAVTDFFVENDLQSQVTRDARFERHTCDGLTLLSGDYFDLRPEDLADIGAVYDRASLVALPPAMRADYVRHMALIKPAAARTLLISMEYPQQEMDGPPFAVAEAEVRRLYQSLGQVERLRDMDVLADNPQFIKRGLSRLHEKVYLIGQGENTVAGTSPP